MLSRIARERLEDERVVPGGRGRGRDRDRVRFGVRDRVTVGSILGLWG